MFLHYLTLHKTETRHWRAEAEAHWHLGPYSSGHHRQSHWPVANTAACMCKSKGRHFEHLLWSSHTTGLESLHTHQNRFFSEPLTPLRGRQRNFFRFCTRYSRLRESHFSGHRVLLRAVESDHCVTAHNTNWSQQLSVTRVKYLVLTRRKQE